MAPPRVNCAKEAVSWKHALRCESTYETSSSQGNRVEERSDDERLDERGTLSRPEGVLVLPALLSLADEGSSDLKGVRGGLRRIFDRSLVLLALNDGPDALSSLAKVFLVGKVLLQLLLHALGDVRLAICFRKVGDAARNLALVSLADLAFLGYGNSGEEIGDVGSAC